MSNPVEEEIAKRWKAEQKDQESLNADTGPRKRQRKAIENGVGVPGLLRQAGRAGAAFTTQNKPIATRNARGLRSASPKDRVVDLSDG